MRVIQLIFLIAKKQQFNFSYYSQVIAYKKTAKYELAIKSLEILQNKLPNYPFYDELAGDIYFSMGKYDRSIKEYKKALKKLKVKNIFMQMI